MRAFLTEIRRTGGRGGFAVILVVCGFNDWLVKLLDEYACRETILTGDAARIHLLAPSGGGHLTTSITPQPCFELPGKRRCGPGTPCPRRGCRRE